MIRIFLGSMKATREVAAAGIILGVIIMAIGFSIGNKLIERQLGNQLRDRHYYQPLAIKELVQKPAAEFGLDPAILYGLVLVESNGVAQAVRQEPAFYKRYLQNQTAKRLGGYWPTSPIARAAEKSARAWSWGLTQVMLQTAREHGFAGPVEDLLKPSINIYWGAKILASKIKRKNGDLTAGLLAYNGGGNHRYPDEVLLNAKGYHGS